MMSTLPNLGTLFAKIGEVWYATVFQRLEDGSLDLVLRGSGVSAGRFSDLTVMTAHAMHAAVGRYVDSAALVGGRYTAIPAAWALSAIEHETDLLGWFDNRLNKDTGWLRRSGTDLQIAQHEKVLREVKAIIKAEQAN